MDLRRPVASGSFYPSDKAKLSSQISGFFSHANANEKYRLVVSPHAGYVYSGLGAASAIGSLIPAKTFIILGPNHTGMGQELSIMAEGAWTTPLGNIEIDSKIAGKIMKAGLAEEDDWAHASEHSIEVQLPFIQHRFPGSKIVPICVTNSDYSEGFLRKCEGLGNLIGMMMEKSQDIGLVASSDFSHYVHAMAARKVDMEFIEKIKALDIPGLFLSLKKNRASVCGYGPIAVAIAAAKSLGLSSGELISYTNSGDVTRDYSSVVAYAAIGFL